MISFLHAADLHLDSPLRGLARYDGAPIERLRTATREAFLNLIEAALQRSAAFVLLAGDIYDRDWQDFHTALFFREQMLRLGRAGIQVFIAHGNHDAEGVISRNVILPDNVKVFSSRKAETFTIDELHIAVHGRSFPDRAVREDLSASYPEPLPGYFNIGVLHTSLTGRPGHDTYAPTTLAALIAKNYDYWALGHVHAREVLAEQPRILFSGCLQGRHANETGAKGCEWVTLGENQLETEFLTLDTVRWHQLDISLDHIEDRLTAQRCVRDRLQELVSKLPDRLHAVRVSLTGCTLLHQEEAERPGSLSADVQSAAQDLNPIEVWIEQVRLNLATPIDRTNAASRTDAVGELVRLVDVLEADEASLRSWSERELSAMFDHMPEEVRRDNDLRLDCIDDLKALLRAAEATVLARLAAQDSSP